MYSFVLEKHPKNFYEKWPSENGGNWWVQKKVDAKRKTPEEIEKDILRMRILHEENTKKELTEEFIKNNPIEKFANDQLTFALKHSKIDIWKWINYTKNNTLKDWKIELNKLDPIQTKKYLAVIETLELIVKKKEFQDNIWITDETLDRAKVAYNNALAWTWLTDRRTRELWKDVLVKQIQKWLSLAISSWETQFVEIGISKENIETYQTYSASSIRNTLMKNPEQVNRKALQVLLSFPDWKEKLWNDGIQWIALYVWKLDYKSKILTELPEDKKKEITSFFENTYQQILGLDIFKRSYDASLFMQMKTQFPTIDETGFNKIREGGSMNPKSLLTLNGIPSINPTEALASLEKIKVILTSFEKQIVISKDNTTKILESNGIKSIWDLLKAYKINNTNPVIVTQSRSIRALNKNEKYAILVELRKNKVPEQDIIYSWIKLESDHDNLRKDKGIIIATASTIKNSWDKWLDKIKKWDQKTLMAISSASTTYVTTEQIKEQTKITQELYKDIYNIYQIKANDLENPAIVENLYNKMLNQNNSWTLWIKEKEFFEILKWIRSSHHERTRAIVEVTKNTEDPKYTTTLLSEVTGSKFTEASLKWYEILNRNSQFPIEIPTDATTFEKRVTYMEMGKIYSSKELWIKTMEDINLGISSLQDYSFSTTWSSGICIKEWWKTLIQNIPPTSVESFLTQVQIMRSCWLDCLTYNIPFMNKITSSGERTVNSLDSEFSANEAVQMLEKVFMLIFGKKLPQKGNILNIIKTFWVENKNKTNPSHGISSILNKKWLITDTGELRMFDIEKFMKNLT
jgi:hypothetical protein